MRAAVAKVKGLVRARVEQPMARLAAGLHIAEMKGKGAAKEILPLFCVCWP